MNSRTRSLAAVLSLAVCAAIAAPAALADPPSHAPAHGWRKKHDPYYVGYTGHRWERDYGIRSGRCNRDEVGTVLGAVVGGAVGSAVASRDNRLIAILAGATVGAIIGREIGRDMDRNDRACFGHALELAEDGRRVSWDGSRRGLSYTLTPQGRFEDEGRICRRYSVVRVEDGRRTTSRGSACRVSDGEWALLDR